MKDRVIPKQFALDLIAGLPDTASLEALREESDLIVALPESYRDEEEGRLIAHAQVVAELHEWFSTSAGRPAPSVT